MRIVRCEQCPAIVGKMAKVRDIKGVSVDLQFGRGRPVSDRPRFMNMDDLSIVREEVEV